MRPTLRLCMLATMLLFAIAGCSDDSTAPETDQSTTGTLEGEVGTADFEITLAAAGDSRRRFEGPFVLRGSNLHYVDSLSALVVDLALSNRGDVAHAEPVGLTFVRLLPEGVTVQNPDNGINDEGAAIVFAFANDDGRWTPGETSLPRTVQFGVERGRAVAFSARLDIGEPIDGGTIAGRVWHDADQDSVLDLDEEGVPGVRIVLSDIGDASAALTDDDDDDDNDSRRSTFTDHDGIYAFHRLPAGVYTVTIAPRVGIEPVTPTSITVLLTETEGDVSDFLDANFGVLVAYEPPDPFPVGVFIEVTGEYAADPDRVIAHDVELSRCGNHPFSPMDGGEDGERDCRRGKLRGPVTAVDDENSTFAVMGTWVYLDPAKIAFDVEVDQRLDVYVHRADDGSLVADKIAEAGNDREYPDQEQVHGRIDEVEVGEGGVIELKVLDTLIIVTRGPHATP